MRGLLVMMLSVALIASAHAQTPPAAGSITALQGQVTVTRGAHSMVAAYGNPIEVGDQIGTAANSRVTITLTDGTQLELAESSKLVIEAEQLDPNGQRKNTRLNLLGGLLRSLVRYAPGNAPNYEVHTPNAVAAARGTNYETSYASGVTRKKFALCHEFTDVGVYDGTVEVSNPTNKSAGSVEVKRGHRTTVPCGLAPLAAVTSIAALGGFSGASGTAIATGAVAGGAAVTAGAVTGAVAASGGFGGSSSSGTPTPSPMTPSQ